MEKLITFTVPCYNSQDYLKRCVDSLLPGGEDVEIILVDDGSTDLTGAMADTFAAEYPECVRAVHKENGGHGSGVNTGLSLATGEYFKVVDSDDWLDADGYRQLLHTLKRFREGSGIRPDMIVANYVYDHLDEKKRRVMAYRNMFPEDTVCTWEDMGRCSMSQYLIMHALIFRTELLREAKIHLPEHMFYVDNLFAYQPLPYVKLLYYMDIDLYHYYLGRADQSVNEAVMMRRIDQQIAVTQMVADCLDVQAVGREHPKLGKYLYRDVSIMMAISSIHLLLIGTEDAWQKRERLWQDLKARNPHMYRRLRTRNLSGLTYLFGKPGAKLTLMGYRAAKKIYLFQ